MILHKSAPQTRRQLLATFAALGTLVTWRAAFARPVQSSALRSFARRVILNTASAADLPTHTSMHPTVRKDWTDLQLAAHLRQMLNISATMIVECSQMSDAILRTHLREQIENNYRHGDLIQLQGWWLSKTEYHAFQMTSQTSV